MERADGLGRLAIAAGELLRVYDVAECDVDGYPLPWHRCPNCRRGDGDCESCRGAGSIKGLIGELADRRCMRCKHPYDCSERHADGGEWSPCDEHCRHAGMVRLPDLAVDPGCVTTVSSVTGPAVQPGYRIEARWRILTIHHLNEDRADCRWWNVAALCQRCRLQLQAGTDGPQSRWLDGRAEWFKPYAAGCLASVHLGEDLNREQTEARLQELLDLECRN